MPLPLGIDQSAAWFQAMDWWEDHVSFYYARARWVVFIHLLANRADIVGKHKKYKGVRRNNRR
jgi:hypothetical protein